MHVHMARALAAEGFTGFRFDFSGIGDIEGPGERRRGPWCSPTTEPGQAASPAPVDSALTASSP